VRKVPRKREDQRNFTKKIKWDVVTDKRHIRGIEPNEQVEEKPSDKKKFSHEISLDRKGRKGGVQVCESKNRRRTGASRGKFGRTSILGGEERVKYFPEKTQRMLTEVCGLRLRKGREGGMNRI